MRRRAFLRRFAIAGFTLVSVIMGCAALPLLAADPTCPRCGAPLEPGARFCGRCGLKLETPAVAPAGAVDRGGAVVQVVTVHDSELTSSYASMAFESNLQVDTVLGSAFAVEPGEFVTDSGLLVGAKEVSLRTPAGRSVPARILGSDAMIGIALLKADLAEVKTLSLRENDPPRSGEGVTAVGFPSAARAGGEPVTAAGVVSGLHRGATGIHPVEDYLQTDASLPRGLAGGPMLDASGRVVGMNTGVVFGWRIEQEQSGIGYAVPADWIGQALAWIRSGAPPRAWIGAYAVAADGEIRDRYKLPPQVKLVVDQIFPGSPAAACGLKRGDGLLKIQGDEASTLPRLQQRLLKSKPGDSVVLDVSRAGEPLHFTATLAPRPDKPRLTGIDALRFFGDLNLLARDGERLVVASVTPGSQIAHSKIVPGDVLQSVLSKKDWVHGAKDNSRWRSVHTVEDLEARLETAYSDLDFCLGLRFKSKDGTKRELLLCEILSPTAAL